MSRGKQANKENRRAGRIFGGRKEWKIPSFCFQALQSLALADGCWKESKSTKVSSTWVWGIMWTVSWAHRGVCGEDWSWQTPCMGKALWVCLPCTEVLLVLWTRPSWHGVILKKKMMAQEREKSVNLRGWLRSQHSIGSNPARQWHSQSRTESQSLADPVTMEQGGSDQSSSTGGQLRLQPACMWRLKCRTQEKWVGSLDNLGKGKLIEQNFTLWRYKGSDPSYTHHTHLEKLFLKVILQKCLSLVWLLRGFMIFPCKRNLKPLQMSPSLQENTVHGDSVVWIDSLLFLPVSN